MLKQCRQKGTMALRIKIIALWIPWINWRNHQRTFSGPSIVCREHRLSENKCNLRQIGDKKGKLKPSGSLCESVDKCEWQENIGKLHASSVSTRKRSEPVKDYFGKYRRKQIQNTKELWNIVMEYDETSQEVITTIAMIKSMTTTARRRSGLPKSPLLPRINNGMDSQRGSFSKADMFVNNGSFVASSRSSSWPTRGVTLASIEFKKKLERRKTRHSKGETNVDLHAKRPTIPGRTDFAEKETTRMTVLTSIFANGRETSNSGASGNTLNQQRSPTSKKSLKSSKRSPSNFTPTTEVDHFSQPLLSIAKITPLRRPKFPDHRSRGHHVKWWTLRGSHLRCLVSCWHRDLQIDCLFILK